MPSYHITRQAENDLFDIWGYTAKQWGHEQADRYLETLEECFTRIGVDRVVDRQPLPHLPLLRSVRCKHHYIFFLRQDAPVIIAIFHERMDILARLMVRLPETSTHPPS